MIELGVEQKQALKMMKDFLKSKQEVFSLIGAAGTGKSSLMEMLVAHLRETWVPHILCAPTHKAKLVLERFAGGEAVTLHKLLTLSPNLELLDLDFNDLKFFTSHVQTQIPKKGVVICDESSMINDDLFDLLVKKCKEKSCKIIFIGDKCQLRPVKAQTSSKVFEVGNQFVLTKVWRQSENNALMPTLFQLREKSVDWFDTSEGEEGSLYCHSDLTQFLKSAIPHFRKAMRDSDILSTKILAYTNARVQMYNDVMRKALWKGDGKEYHEFEFLTGYENLEFNKVKFWNSMDYIIVGPPKQCDNYISGFMSLPGYKLALYDAVDNIICDVFILSREIEQDYLSALASKIEQIRTEAINLKDIGRQKASSDRWREYYKLIGSFTTPVDLYYDNRLIRKKSFDYGYACSTHKSQGSSFGDVFVDIKNINICRNEDERRQLQYVALSRTRKDAHILQ